MEKKDIIENINLLLEKYKDDKYMYSKTKNYICDQLPSILENLKNTHEEKQLRIEELTNEQDNFIKTFLNDNQYFYIQYSNTFFYYNGKHYKMYNEDDILYDILTTINNTNRTLITWKHKTKVYIMKRIKDKNILTSIPESETIQFVLKLLYPLFFTTKEQAKYFLTILGDNILKKNTELIHFIGNYSKSFLNELNNFSQNLFGINIINTFKFKYSDHDYNNSRLIMINDCMTENDNIWKGIINENFMDIICVASHYSTRYNSSDEYVLNTDNEKIIDYVFYLKNTTKDELIQLFINDFLQFNSQTNINIEYKITYKNIHFLWKLFLETKNIPNVISQNLLKEKIIYYLKDNYNTETDTFINISSYYLPSIQNFINFWNSTIKNVQEDLKEQNYYEIDEIIKLFKLWYNNKRERSYSENDTDINIKINKNNKKININEKQIINIISFYYPNVLIKENRFIHGIFCSLWDKKNNIINFLNILKEDMLIKLKDNIDYSRTISIYDIYNHYCNYYKSLKQSLNTQEITQITIEQNTEIIIYNGVVSKSFFKIIIINLFKKYIIDEKYLSYKWLND